MSENSAIEWTDHTFNPWEGCQKVGPGCDHCYAETRNARFSGGTAVNWGPGAPRRRTSAGNWHKPLAWNNAHAEFFAAHGRRQRVFCASLADVFDNAVGPQWRADLFALIEKTPNLDWLLLTKRIGNVPAMMIDVAHSLFWMDGLESPLLPANVLLGATIVNQEEADRDIPKLLAAPARRRFLSMEPLLGPVSFEGMFASDIINDGTNALELLDWVIVGGESGPGARPMSIQWARSLRDQCKAVGVPFLFKQWGEWAPAGVHPAGHPGKFAFGDYEYDPARFLQVEGYPRQFTMFGSRCVLERVGKKTAGRRLDGVQHDGYPREA